MPVNSSNISLPSPLLCYSNSSLYPDFFVCFDHIIGSLIFIAFTFINIFLLLPLYILVLWMGFRRWRYQRSVASGTTSHSDVFTYNMIIVEIAAGLGSVFYCCGIYTCSPKIMVVGYYAFSATYSVQAFFHCLTCVERYLAVVSPHHLPGPEKGGRGEDQKHQYWVMSISSSSNSSTDYFYSKCQQSIASNVIFTAYTFISSLLLPLYILVLYRGVQRWRRRRSVPAGTSPTDVFTYHIVIVEICGVLGIYFTAWPVWSTTWPLFNP
ncbi:uncharacterized protein AKAME5_002077300 [Lates japonicus]|uniref:G protein-coupled receptor n=1 Tax=Lates japonicus TaxID=270547 RepID=A0AAD3NCC6_LATJO|nr:uncharacterized protein AKAME5_002077300 [Lates japonicus]